MKFAEFFRQKKNKKALRFSLIQKNKSIIIYKKKRLRSSGEQRGKINEPRANQERNIKKSSGSTERNFYFLIMIFIIFLCGAETYTILLWDYITPKQILGNTYLF